MSHLFKSTFFVGLLVVAFGCSESSSGGGAPTQTPNTQAPANNGSVNLTVESVADNGQVVVPINLTSVNNTPAGLQFDLNFDNSKLSFVKMNVGSQTSAAGKTVTPNVLPNGNVRVLITGLNTNTIADGTVAEAVFTTTGNTGDTAAVALIDVKASDVSAQEISATKTDGTVTIQ